MLVPVLQLISPVCKTVHPFFFFFFLVADQSGKELTMIIYSTSQDYHKQAACQPGKCEFDHKFGGGQPG
jgi:hypothetical protein